MKISFILDKLNSNRRILVKLCKICLEVISSFMTELKNINRNLAAPACQHSCNGKSVTTVISFTTKNRKRMNEPAILFKPFKAFCGCPFHQVNGCNGFMFHCVLIPGSYLLSI